MSEPKELKLASEGKILVIRKRPGEESDPSSSFFDALFRWKKMPLREGEEEDAIDMSDTPYKYLSIICKTYNSGSFNIATDVPPDWRWEDFQNLLFYSEKYCMDASISLASFALLRYLILSSDSEISEFIDSEKQVVKRWPGKKKKRFFNYVYAFVALSSLKPGEMVNEREATELFWNAAGCSGDKFELRRELVERGLVGRQGAPAIYTLNMEGIKKMVFTGDIAQRSKDF